MHNVSSSGAWSVRLVQRKLNVRWHQRNSSRAVNVLRRHVRNNNRDRCDLMIHHDRRFAENQVR